jgi:TPP-dependent trihydroxycyclohexane-1,2-dione (THcHDO) dehydratase
MANAMPMAIGAQATHPNRQVISLSGDGGFTMMMGDFITLAQLNLPVKVVIFNNGLLGFVELEMKAAGFTDFAVNLQNPDFAAMANAMGIHGARVEDPADLRGALEAAFAHPGPALVLEAIGLLGLALGGRGRTWHDRVRVHPAQDDEWNVDYWWIRKRLLRAATIDVPDPNDRGHADRLHDLRDAGDRPHRGLRVAQCPAHL